MGLRKQGAGHSAGVGEEGDLSHIFGLTVLLISAPGLTCPVTVSLVEPRRTEGDKTSLKVALSSVAFGS